METGNKVTGVSRTAIGVRRCEDLPGWLGRAGWRVETHDGVALAEVYGRADPDADFVGFLAAVRD